MQQKASQLLTQFEQRPDKVWCFTLASIKENTPEHQALSDIIHANHADYDTAYNAIVDVLMAIDRGDITDNDMDSLNDLADSNVPIYNSDLTAWLAKSHYNVTACDTSMADIGAVDEGIIQNIKQGYYYALTVIYSQVYDLVSNTSNTTPDHANNS